MFLEVFSPLLQPGGKARTCRHFSGLRLNRRCADAEEECFIGITVNAGCSLLRVALSHCHTRTFASYQPTNLTCLLPRKCSHLINTYRQIYGNKYILKIIDHITVSWAKLIMQQAPDGALSWMRFFDFILFTHSRETKAHTKKAHIHTKTSLLQKPDLSRPHLHSFSVRLGSAWFRGSCLEL